MAINIDVAYNGNSIASLEDQTSVPVVYNGNTIVTMSAAGVKTLNCNGKMMASDVEIGSKVLNCAGKVMASDIVITAEEAVTDLYIVKAGVIQSGFAFAVDQIAYSSSSNAAHASTVSMQSGYIQVRGNPNGSTRGGSAYRMTTNIASIIGDYAYLNVKCKRYVRNNTNYYERIGTYNSGKSGNYSSQKFLDYNTKQGGGADSSAVTLKIALTNTTKSSGTVQICFAYTTYVGQTTGVDIYDIWMSK